MGQGGGSREVASGSEGHNKTPEKLGLGQLGDSETYGTAVVVTVTFKGPERFFRAEKLEAAAERIGHSGIFTEQVEVEEHA